MSLLPNPVFTLAERAAGRLTLRSAEGHVAHVFVLEDDILRVLLLPRGELRFPRTWAIAPGAEDVPLDGRDRFDLSGFALPDFALGEADGCLRVETTRVRLSIRLTGFFCTWQIRSGDDWVDAAGDRPTQAVNFGWWDDRVYHYLKRESDEMYFGLGERAGDANRHGQSYRLCNIDAMGYSARTTDPLYKHIPFYLTWRRAAQVGYGLFYDTLSDCTFDFGRELDNYHGHYRYFVADHGDLDYYFIAGPQPARVTARYTWLTGRPALMPKWSLGYSGSTMSYTDAPDAQRRMDEFLEACAQHDILCDSFHLSSGYTSIDGKRYVFNWNRDKFPDPAGFAARYLAHGVHLCANIKPCLLRDHPRFAEVRAAGLLISDPDGQPSPVQFWDETGAYLDFTNPRAYDWWKARVTDALLEYGIDSTWNDNNEFEVWSDRARIDGFGHPRPAREAKPLHSLLMMRASREAQRAFAPGKRPYLVTRCGAAGMQRYAQTWSGDNYSSWETLRYNIRMGTGLALSGVSNTGHDIGGFAGPKPDPELFLRWVQHGIFLPRFSIHSWNDDQTANEPWMHPEITAAVRDLIKFRYRLIPYLYDLGWRSHRSFEPMIRPTFLEFPDDPRCFAENDDMMLGRSLLVASVVDPGHDRREVYLPAGAAWIDFWSGERFIGGQTVSRPAPWAQPPLLVREGSLLPLNVAEQHFAEARDERGFALFAAVDGRFAECIVDDDGDSELPPGAEPACWRAQVAADGDGIELALRAEGVPLALARAVAIFLPRQESRRLICPGWRTVSDAVGPQWREVRLAAD